MRRHQASLPPRFANHSVRGILIGLLLACVACASSSDDEREEPRLTWKCWADTSDGTCECRGYEPGESGDHSGTNIESVEDCGGRELCFTYDNNEFENEECSCGDGSFYPTKEDISDVEPSASCPPG